MRILEIGSHLAVAYAGMILAEQGHQVTKWLSPDRRDPVQELTDGDRLWDWLNTGKDLQPVHARSVPALMPGDVDLVIDNLRWSAWAGWGVNPARQALRLGVRWTSLRDDFDGRSFGATAQARAWGDHLGCVPAYLGSTAAGLWLAFKAVAAPETGHFVVRHGAVLAKLIEGELAVPAVRDGRTSPWSPPGTYGMTDTNDGVRALYRGQWLEEPLRTDAWRRTHLRHADGRYAV